MRNTRSKNGSMEEKLKIMENEKHTLQDLEYVENTENYGKRNTNTD